MAMIRIIIWKDFYSAHTIHSGFRRKGKIKSRKELLKGKDIIIIEDSIIRGTTVSTRVRALREIGVKRIHMLGNARHHRFPCHYGIDFSTKGELIASSKSVQKLSDYLGLDSLYYLSLDGLLAATGINPANICAKHVLTDAILLILIKTSPNLP